MLQMKNDFQIATTLKKIARDIEYTIINGVYAKATSAAVANKTRGLIALCAAVNNVNNATAATLNKTNDTSIVKGNVRQWRDLLKYGFMDQQFPKTNNN